MSKNDILNVNKVYYLQDEKKFTIYIIKNKVFKKKYEKKVCT